MDSTREIVSLQFGHYSNYVGAHFWNIQELSFNYEGQNTSDINHDVLYREGSTIDGRVTYTPRVLLADLKGSLHTLPESGGLVTSINDEILEWTDFEKQEQAKIEKNDYLKHIDSVDGSQTSSLENYDFESNITTWTDYLYPRFHRKSINVVNEFKHNDSEVPFDTYHSGINIWKTNLFSENFCDDIRYYVEECNSIQGFKVSLDSSDGFGGLGSNCIQYLADEYPNKSLFALPLIASHFSDNDPKDQKERDISNFKDSTRVINLLLLYESLFENSSLFVPICTGERGWRKPGHKRLFYNTNYNAQLYYHTSAIIAAALDTISLKYRNKNTQFTLSDLCADMTGYGRKMASASLGLPFDMRQKDDLIDHLDNCKVPLWTSITPSCTIASDKVFQHVSVRGIPESRLKRPVRIAKNQLQMAAYQCNTVKDMFELYFQCNCFASATNVTISPNGLSINSPFPKIFSKDLNRNGFHKEFVNDETVESVPVIAGLHNGNFMFDTLETICREAKRIKIGKLHKFKEEGLEDDDVNEAIDKIKEIQSNYEDNYEL